MRHSAQWTPQHLDALPEHPLAVDVVPVDAWGTGLSFLAVVLVGSLAATLQWASGSEILDEKTRLQPGKDGDARSVAGIALGGSAFILLAFTGCAWFVGQFAPLATASIGISILFTLRPVKLKQSLELSMATAPWICIIWLLSSGAMPPKVIVYGILGEPKGQLEPWTMVVTFVGAVYLCSSLEATGGLNTFARSVAGFFGASRLPLFLCFSLLASCMTVLIPDDVVTMTLAPVVCMLCNSLRIEAEPHLYGQFYCGNILAVTLVTGNITNVLIAEVTKDRFLSFAMVMVLPGIVAGFSAVALLYLAFRDELHRPTSTALPTTASKDLELSTKYPIRGVLCFCRLSLTFTWAALDWWHHWPIWLTVGGFAAVACAMDLMLDLCKVEGCSTHTWETLSSLPLDLFAFFPGLFVLVQQLVHAGIIDLLAASLVGVVQSPRIAMLTVGFTSCWLAQVVSTAPMTVLFLQVIIRVPGWASPEPASTAYISRELALYSLVLGSNFCGNVTRIGTMGGQMWFKIASAHGIVLSDARMVCRGIFVMMPVLAVALATLYCMHGWLRT